MTVLGDLIEAGLPNITGEVQVGAGSNHSLPWINGEGSGAFRNKSKANTTAFYSSYTSSSQTALLGYTFDASRSSSIYGNSSTVQPQSIKVFILIKY